MANKNFTINILYYIEKNEIVLHCPQFALFGVSLVPTCFDNMNDVAISAFQDKLNKRMARFKSPQDFFSNLVTHGVWSDQNGSTARPMPLEHYINKLSYLKDTMEQPGAKNISLEYNLQEA